MQNIKNKKRICIILASITALLLFMNFFLNMRKGIYLKDTFFYLKNDELFETLSDDNIIRQGNHYTIHIRQQVDELDLEVDGDRYTFTFDGGEKISGIRIGDTLTDEEGFPLEYKWMMDDLAVRTGDFYIAGGPEARNIDLALCVMKIHDREYQTRLDFGTFLLMILGGVMENVIGVALALWPEETYEIFNSWFFKHVELTDAAVIFRQISGIVLVGLGLLFSSGILALL